MFSRTAFATLIAVASLAFGPSAEARAYHHTAHHTASAASTSASAAPSDEATGDPWGAGSDDKPALQLPSGAGLGLIAGGGVMLGGVGMIGLALLRRNRA